MGFGNISICGSDAASDAHWNLKQAYPDGAIESLKEEFVANHSRYNTPGPVNVALCLADGDVDLTNLQGYNELYEKTVEWLGLFIEHLEKTDEAKDLLEQHKQLAERLQDKKPNNQ